MHSIRQPLHVHVLSCIGYNHIRLYWAAEDEFAPCGILYRYQSTDPYDGRNCEIILLPIQQEKMGIQERTE